MKIYFIYKGNKMKNILLSTIVALTAVTGCSKTDSAKEAAQDASKAASEAVAVASTTTSPVAQEAAQTASAAANDTAVQEANDQEKEAGQSKVAA
jgi:hypothetical protein